MNVYDTANRLAEELKQSEEYSNYKMAKETLNINHDLKNKIKEFEEARYDAQITAMQTGKNDEEKVKKMQDLYVELIQDDIAKKYFERFIAREIAKNEAKELVENAIENSKEGIMILEDEELRDKLDIKIYVDTEDDIRILRRIQRDIKERGRTVDSVIEQYLSTVKPAHDQFIEPYKKYADIIMPEGGQNEVAIDIVITKIKTQLN